MPTLKKDHPVLYQRLKAHAVVHALLGLGLIFSPPIPVPRARATGLNGVAPLAFFGFIFLIIGIMIFIAMFKSKKNYQSTRRWLMIATIYSGIWWVSLIASLFTSGRAGMGITVVWGYWTYDILKTIRDPAWKAIKIIKELRNGSG